MKKALLLGVAAAAVAAATGAWAAGPAVHSPQGKAHSPRHAPGVANVLYDQNGTDSGLGIVSQNFESSFDAYDAEAADDFTVTEGSKWIIREVDVSGVYFNGSGPASSVNVTFYNHVVGRKGKRSTPGTVRKAYSAVVPAIDNFGSFAITLPNAIRLKPGNWWVSVQANLDFFAGGEWGWENQTTAVGNPAVWRNGGGGFTTGCNNWGQENVCIADGQGDHMFTLRGDVIGGK